MIKRIKSILRRNGGTLMLMAVALLFVPALLGYQLWVSYQEQITVAEHGTRNVATLLDTQVSDVLRRIDGDLKAITNEVPIAALYANAAPGYVKRIDRMLDGHSINFPETIGYRIADANGAALYTSSGAANFRAVASDHADLRWLADDTKAEPVYSRVTVDSSTGRQVISIARSMRDEHGRFMGVAYAILRLDHYKQLFQSVNLGQNGSVALLRSDSYSLQVRWPELPNQVNKPLPPEDPTVRHLMAGDREATLWFPSRLDGKERIYSLRKIDRYPFYLVVGMSLDDALAGWYKQAGIVGVLALLLITFTQAMLFRHWRMRNRQNEFIEELGIAATAFESNEAMVITDENSVILKVNNAFAKITGYTSSEAVGQTPRLFRSGRQDADFYKRFWGALTDAGGWRGEVWNCRKNGEEYLCGLAVTAVKNAEGFITHFVGTHSDITEQRRAEYLIAEQTLELAAELKHRLEVESELRHANERLANTQRLESVGRLAAGVAHEVKNPLTIIRFGIDYLARQATSNASQSEVIQDISDATDRADRIVRELLGFSRLSAGDSGPVDLNAAIERVLHISRHDIELRNISAVTDLQFPLPKVFGDCGQLEQVLVNLISNAAQAIVRDGRIVIKTRSCTLGADDFVNAADNDFVIGDHIVVVEVRDSGPGLSADIEDRIFDPFFTTKPQGEGTGLGLSVSRNIVLTYDGSLSLRNHPDGGAVATLSFRAIQGVTE